MAHLGPRSERLHLERVALGFRWRVTPSDSQTVAELPGFSPYRLRDCSEIHLRILFPVKTRLGLRQTNISAYLPERPQTIQHNKPRMEAGQVAFPDDFPGNADLQIGATFRQTLGPSFSAAPWPLTILPRAAKNLLS